MHNAGEWIAQQLRDCPWGQQQSASVFAPANIALCKYWGKRDGVFNLPVTDSLSISLGNLGSDCRLSLAEEDQVYLGGELLPEESAFVKRLQGFLDMFRGENGYHYRVETSNTVPTAAGFASSASGFASIVMALNQLHGWGLSDQILSCFARIGSGSACRSLWNGFVHWHAGSSADGADSYGEPLHFAWPSIRIGLVHVTAEKKPIASREAMNRTVETSSLYAGWSEQVQKDLPLMLEAIHTQDFGSLGMLSEQNALAMHATMIAARPPVFYWKKRTLEVMHHVWEARAEGIPVYFTIDAGPNVKLLFEDAMTEELRSFFPGMQVTNPWDV
jgi:diphosphomevalonate decarboxylase